MNTDTRNTDTSKVSRQEPLPNREVATHKYSVGAYVLHSVGVRSTKEMFKVTRLLPDGGAGFQYRIKGEREGFERVVTESSLEGIG
jgi:hypothetical protein